VQSIRKKSCAAVVNFHKFKKHNFVFTDKLSLFDKKSTLTIFIKLASGIQCYWFSKRGGTIKLHEEGSLVLFITILLLIAIKNNILFAFIMHKSFKTDFQQEFKILNTELYVKQFVY